MTYYLGRAIASYLSTFNVSEDSPYRNLAKVLAPGDTVVTFNWDTLLEQILEEEGRPYTYGPDPKSVSVLKLHGSRNWIRLYKNQEVQQGFRRLRGQLYEVDDFDGFIDKFGEEYSLAIVAPSYQKMYPTELDFYWYKAFQALAASPSVVIIGYSMPASDYEARALFRLSLGHGSPVSVQLAPEARRILLVGPNQAVKDKLKSLLKTDVIHRLTRFEDWAGHVIDDDLLP
jgi:hypothetical protein